MGVGPVDIAASTVNGMIMLSARPVGGDLLERLQGKARATQGEGLRGPDHVPTDQRAGLNLATLIAGSGWAQARQLRCGVTQAGAASLAPLESLPGREVIIRVPLRLVVGVACRWTVRHWPCLTRYCSRPWRTERPACRGRFPLRRQRGLLARHVGDSARITRRTHQLTRRKGGCLEQQDQARMAPPVAVRA